MPLFLVRHGETEWNLLGRQQGRADSPLTEVGRRQAFLCADVLAHHVGGGYVRLVSSPLGRAVASAEVVREHLGQPTDAFSIVSALAEYDWGDWEGLTKGEMQERFPAEFSNRQLDRWNYEVPGGESYRLLSERVRPWLQEVDFAGDIIAVVHDMVSRVVRGAHLRLDPQQTLELVHPHTCVYRLGRGGVEALHPPTV